MAVGLLNADPYPDLVVSNSGSYTISVLLNNGQGGFGPKTDTNLGGALAADIEDLDHDGFQDVVVANGDTPGLVSVLLGNGNGTFKPRVAYGVGDRPWTVELADLDRDGEWDVITSGDVNSAKFSILTGTGNGTLGGRVDYATGHGADQVTACDVDGDEWLDVLVSTSTTVSVSHNQQDGTFGVQPRFTVGRPHSVVIEDFDLDGVPDLAACGLSGTSGTAFLMLGIGDGIFDYPSSYTTGNCPLTIASEDFNADEFLDVVTANDQSGNVSVLLGYGDGTFASKVDYPSGASSNYVAVGDFNEDSALDLAVSNYNAQTVSILLGNGNGTFQPRYSCATTAAGSAWVDLGDLNGDDHTDIVVANRNWPTSLSVLLGNGDGTFDQATHFDVAVPKSVCLGDVNEDGNLDAVTGSYARIDVLLGNGSGGFGPALYFPAGASSFHVVLADINADGHLDACASNYHDSFVTVLLGNGDGTFETKLDYGSPFEGRGLAIGDVNGDYKPDVVCTSDSDTDNIGVLLNIGPGAMSGMDPELISIPGMSLASPNPFRRVTSVSYTIATPGHISITIHNSMGRLVRTLVDQWEEPGLYEATWNGSSSLSSRLAPGVYFLRLSTGGTTSSQRIVYMR